MRRTTEDGSPLRILNVVDEHTSSSSSVGGRDAWRWVERC
jgi:hypothetical protein